jgi:ketosteroid isomerase-like protein
MRAHFFRSEHIAARETVTQASVWMLLLMLCVPAATAASIPHPHPQPRQVVHIIETLEARWQQAELDANTTVMAEMLSDDYLGIYGDGTIATKAETIANFKSGTVHFTAIDTSDRKIRVFGTTAVVVSKAEVTGMIDGENISGRYRYTRVYHRDNNRVWKIVSFEASTIREHRHSQ